MAIVGWIIIGVTALMLGCILLVLWKYGCELKTILISSIASVVIIVGMIFGGFWYYGNVADGIRVMKDQESALNNGIEREITITAEDGREIFYYKGKCDIETDNGNYILFEDEEGKRQIIYWGITDTIIISEL